MIVWTKHSGLSDLLTKHHDLVLWDAYHAVKAALLYPCECVSACNCLELRKKVVCFYPLNLRAYLKAKKARRTAAILQATRLVLGLPETPYWEENFCNAYPLWVMDKKRKKRYKAFKSTAYLTWVPLHLGDAYEAFIYGERYASIRDALKVLLGNTPLKSPHRKGELYICGEKAYEQHFKTYRPFCHFLAAFVRHNLLTLSTTTIRGQHFLTEESLQPLPAGIDCEERVVFKPFREQTYTFV